MELDTQGLYSLALTWLDSHINYERQGPGDSNQARHDPQLRLQRVRKLMELLDDPQHKFETVHLTGTNGKTSTSRMLTQLFLAQGLRTGTFISPHLEHINERIAVNGEPISNGEFAEVLESIRLIETLIDMSDTPTYFEILTAAAYRHFADAPVDVGVIEVGVGGTWDSTNVLDSKVAVITNIGHDHHNYLGPTLEDIARQKAGIVKPGSTLVTAEQNPELRKILVQPEHEKTFVMGEDFALTSNQLAVGGRLLDLRTPYGRYPDVFLSVRGSHQGLNAITAVVAAEAFFDTALPFEVVRDALGSVTTPGRFEVLGRNPLRVIDGAHNVDGAQRLVETLRDELLPIPGESDTAVERRVILVVGMLTPHNPRELLETLQANQAHLVVACTADSPRAVPAEEIARAASDLGANAIVSNDVASAIKEAESAAQDDDVIVVTGSLYVAGAARTALT